MRPLLKTITAAFIGAAAFPAVATAGEAFATTDLNMRAGPGPQYPVVATISAEQTVALHGCTETGNWCDVVWDGNRGWAYAEYLAYAHAGERIIVPQVEARAEIPVVTYEPEVYWETHYRDRPFYEQRDRYVTTGGTGVATGIAGGAATGAVLGGPVGAVLGAAAGATLGAAIDPPQHVRTYVVDREAEPVLLEGEIVVGAGVPDAVVLHPVPDYDYQFAIVNHQRVLVDPQTRQIVYIFR
jgi:uncharacterized protein YraI